MKQCKGGTWVRGRGTISFVDRSSIRYTRHQPTSDDSISACLLSPDYPSLRAQWPRWLPQVGMIPAWSSSVRSNPPLYCQWPGSVERESSPPRCWSWTWTLVYSQSLSGRRPDNTVKSRNCHRLLPCLRRRSRHVSNVWQVLDSSIHINPWNFYSLLV